jgi:hypothetical protein
MKKIFFILIAAALFAGFMMKPVRACAEENEQCLNDCLQKSYASQYCQENCSTDPNPMTHQQSIRQIEPHCVDDCTNSGYDSAYCTKACTY